MEIFLPEGRLWIFISIELHMASFYGSCIVFDTSNREKNSYTRWWIINIFFIYIWQDGGFRMMGPCTIWKETEPPSLQPHPSWLHFYKENFEDYNCFSLQIKWLETLYNYGMAWVQYEFSSANKFSYCTKASAVIVLFHDHWHTQE